MRWVGGATAVQLPSILDDGVRAVQRTRGGFAEALARADRLYANGKNAEAVKAYRHGVALRAPRDWRYGRTVESSSRARGPRSGGMCAPRAGPTRASNTPSAANVAPPASDAPSSCRPTTRAPGDHRRIRAGAGGDGRSEAKPVGIRSIRPLPDPDRRARGRPLRRRPRAAHARVVELPRRRGRPGEDAGPAGVFRFAPPLGIHRAQGTPTGDPDARAIRAGSSRRVQPAGAPGGRLEMHEWDKALAASDRAAKAYGPRRLGILRTRAESTRERGQGRRAEKRSRGRLRRRSAAGRTEEPGHGRRAQKSSTLWRRRPH